MKCAPDKIYLHPAINDKDRPAALWMEKPSVFKDEEIYIRKDALLEWLESVASLNLFAIEGVANDYQHGKNDAYQHVIDKLNNF